jgi:hypothetical protein
MENDHTALVQPLSLWSKIKTGVKSFFKAAVSYIPKGLMISAVLFGGSAVLEAMTGFGLLGVTQAFNAGAGAVATKLLTTMAIGSVLTGGIEAYKGVAAAIKQNETAMAQQQAALSRGRTCTPERQQYTEYAEPLTPPPTPALSEHLVNTAKIASHLVH